MARAGNEAYFFTFESTYEEEQVVSMYFKKFEIFRSCTHTEKDQIFYLSMHGRESKNRKRGWFERERD